MSTFTFNSTLALASLPLLLAFFFFKGSKKETLPFSNLNVLKNAPQSVKVRLAHLPKKLYTLCFFLLLLSLWDFRLERPLQNVSSKEGVALFLVLDTSGSMKDPSFYSRHVSKIEELKNVATSFVQERPQDLIGLIAFARGADVLSPLTLNHSFILQKISTLSAERPASQDATSIGYALLKTLNLIETTQRADKSYTILSKAIILVTDGFERPYKDDLSNPLRSASLEMAAHRLKEANVKLYIVNVDGNFSLKKELEPQKKQLISAAKETGGQTFFVDGVHPLSEIFSKLNTLEKSPLPEELTERLVSLSPLLLTLTLLLLVGSFVIENTYLRRVP